MPSFSNHVPYDHWKPDDPLEAAETFRESMARRRSIRTFSRDPVDRSLIESIVATAGTAPSGANKQPWRFVAIDDPDLKRQIREGAEEEERLFYQSRAGADWLRDLKAIGTDEHKPFLEDAPWLIVVFKMMKDDREGMPSDQVYYVNESVGIAVGMLLAAAQQAGLATLTHTPSPMKFLARILERPDYERPYMLIPIGWPAQDASVPDIERKRMEDIFVLNRGDLK
ncbi:MAG: nitroreductase family protein [Phycisphaerae bacterium]|nr:nitroreductase family protein [Phycisphaerae bacterium]|tara:strand:+ start:1453 stop:2130 length:678 start_codon:yes stop_codon:yes gene_type:complete